MTPSNDDTSNEGGGGDGASSNSSAKKVRSASESTVQNDFFNLVKYQLTQLVRSGKHREAWTGRDSTKYQAEYAIVQEHYTPFIWGVGCAFACLLTFRLAPNARKAVPSPVSRLPSRQGRRSAYQFDRPGDSQKDEAANNLLSLPSDVALSLLIGVSTYFFLTDTEKLRKDFAGLPLVQGRSLVSDELCGPFQAQYQRYPASFWQKTSHEKEYPILASIRTFVQNCQERSAYEDELRRQKGLTSQEPVVVPPPGVPNSRRGASEWWEDGDNGE